MGFGAPLAIQRYIDALGTSGALRTPAPPAHGDPDEPYLWGSGPAEFSPCTALAIAESVVWDVNGHYRALGFTYPYRPIRRELRERYTALRGWESERMTAAFMVLIDREQRRAYDAAPLAQPHLDPWLRGRLKVAAQRRGHTRRARGETVTDEQVLAEWGLVVLSPEELAELARLRAEKDHSAGLDQTGDLRHAGSSDPTARLPWAWSYYLWRSASDDTGRLEVWQGLLAAACARRGLRRRLAVGFTGVGPRRARVRMVGRRLVCFLPEHLEPTAELAAEAVASLPPMMIGEENRMSTPEVPEFGQGIENAQKDLVAGRTRRPRTDWWGIKDKEEAVLRFLDPSSHWRYARKHSFVPTRGPAPEASEDEAKRYPKTMGAICRHDKALKSLYSDCYICDKMRRNNGDTYFPAQRIFARAVVRTEVIGTEDMVEAGLISPNDVGMVLWHDDEMIDYPVLDAEGKPTEETVKVPRIVVVEQSNKNFFAQVSGYDTAYARKGGILGRDVWVKRVGDDQQTSYTIAAQDPETVFPDHVLTHLGLKQADVGERLFSLTDEQVRKFYLEQPNCPNLAEIMLAQSTDDYYARYFDVDKPHPDSKRKRGEGDQAEESPGAPAEQQAKPVDGGGAKIDEERLAKLRERLGSKTRTPAGE